jgi:hypothetical protein
VSRSSNAGEQQRAAAPPPPQQQPAGAVAVKQEGGGDAGGGAGAHQLVPQQACDAGPSVCSSPLEAGAAATAAGLQGSNQP